MRRGRRSLVINRDMPMQGHLFLTTVWGCIHNTIGCLYQPPLPVYSVRRTASHQHLDNIVNPHNRPHSAQLLADDDRCPRHGSPDLGGTGVTQKRSARSLARL